MRYRFHTCRPVYRKFARIAATVRSVQPVPVRCEFRPGSAADGHGIPASFSARVIRAALCPASRCANIHTTTGAVAGSGSSRCACRPYAAGALFGCGPASASRYPAGAVDAGLADLHAEVARLTAENARLLRLLELTPGQARPPTLIARCY